MMRTIKLNITFSLTLNFIAIVLAITGTLNPDVARRSITQAACLSSQTRPCC